MATGLPAGLTIDPARGAITGAPNETTAPGEPATVTVTASDMHGATTSVSFRWAVTDAPLHVTAQPLLATAGAPLTAVPVAHFTDEALTAGAISPLGQCPLIPGSGPIPGGTIGSPGTYSATIDWGDGTPVGPGQITADGNGGFTVSGDHDYAAAGAYTLTITALDA